MELGEDWRAGCGKEWEGSNMDLGEDWRAGCGAHRHPEVRVGVELALLRLQLRCDPNAAEPSEDSGGELVLRCGRMGGIRYGPANSAISAASSWYETEKLPSETPMLLSSLPPAIAAVISIASACVTFSTCAAFPSACSRRRRRRRHSGIASISPTGLLGKFEQSRAHNSATTR